jgi:hypothetical protein
LAAGTSPTATGGPYCFIYEAWTLFKTGAAGKTEGGPNIADFSTCSGQSSSYFYDGNYIDGANGGGFKFAHNEWGLNSAVHVGAVNPTTIHIINVDVSNYENSSGPCTTPGTCKEVFLDVGSVGTKVDFASSLVSKQDLIYDNNVTSCAGGALNGTACDILSTTNEKATAGYIQQGTSYDGTVGFWYTGNTAGQSVSNYTNSTVTPTAFFTESLYPIAPINFMVDCSGVYQTANVAGALVLAYNSTVTVPTSVTLTGDISYNLTGGKNTLTVSCTSCATGNQIIMTGTAPAATGTNYPFRVYGEVEFPNTPGGTFSIRAATSTATDAITIPRDSVACHMDPIP